MLVLHGVIVCDFVCVSVWLVLMNALHAWLERSKVVSLQVIKVCKLCRCLQLVVRRLPACLFVCLPVCLPACLSVCWLRPLDGLVNEILTSH